MELGGTFFRFQTIQGKRIVGYVGLHLSNREAWKSNDSVSGRSMESPKGGSTKYCSRNSCVNRKFGIGLVRGSRGNRREHPN